MSNKLNDSIGSELIADEEKSIHERMNNNTINTYKIKMKTDLQNKKHNHDNYDIVENSEFSKNQYYNNIGNNIKSN